MHDEASVCFQIIQAFFRDFQLNRVEGLTMNWLFQGELNINLLNQDILGVFFRSAFR